MQSRTGPLHAASRWHPTLRPPGLHHEVPHAEAPCHEPLLRVRRRGAVRPLQPGDGRLLPNTGLAVQRLSDLLAFRCEDAAAARSHDEHELMKRTYRSVLSLARRRRRHGERSDDWPRASASSGSCVPAVQVTQRSACVSTATSRNPCGMNSLKPPPSHRSSVSRFARNRDKRIYTRRPQAHDRQGEHRSCRGHRMIQRSWRSITRKAALARQFCDPLADQPRPLSPTSPSAVCSTQVRDRHQDPADVPGDIAPSALSRRVVADRSRSRTPSERHGGAVPADGGTRADAGDHRVFQHAGRWQHKGRRQAGSGNECGRASFSLDEGHGPGGRGRAPRCGRSRSF